MITIPRHPTITISMAKPLVVALTIKLMADLTEMWGSPGLGLVLTRAYFSGDYPSTDELAVACGVSDQTIRNWIKPMINVDRVRVIKDGRRICYKAREEWANRTAEKLISIADEFAKKRDQVVVLGAGVTT